MSFDMRGFEREVNRQLKGAVDDAARQFEREMNGLSRSLAGRPLSVIKPRLKRTLAQGGGQISEPELTEYAEAIRDGVNFNVRTNIRP